MERVDLAEEKKKKPKKKLKFRKRESQITSSNPHPPPGVLAFNSFHSLFYFVLGPLTRKNAHQTPARAPLLPLIYLAARPLSLIQLSPQIPRPSHQFLVLVLLHLEFSLPLHADGLPGLGPHLISFTKLFPPQLTFPHVVQERLPWKQRR